MDVTEIKKQAEEELRHERFRELVDKEKEKLKTKRSIWQRIFPYRIYFIKLGEANE